MKTKYSVDGMPIKEQSAVEVIKNLISFKTASVEHWHIYEAILELDERLKKLEEREGGE